MEIGHPSNKEKIAVVVVGYNRQLGLQRLLKSLEFAEYENHNVPLVISIDCSGNESLYSFVENYQWPHGEKYTVIQKERLGLKKHIFQCIALTKYFRGVVLLEDDLFVSRYFYSYAFKNLEKYEDENRVAGIALYNNEYDGFNNLPIQRENIGYDVYAYQTVCSWGEIFNERMWNTFSRWLEKWDGDFESIDMNSSIKRWERAWSKYMYAYLVQTDSFFIYPYVSLTTNFNDAGGEHGGGNSSAVQVSFLQGNRQFQLADFDELVKYDVYGNNVAIAKWLGLNRKDLTVDYYGNCDKYYGRFVLSPFKLPYKISRSFAQVMRPWEMNIKYKIDGEGLFLYDRECCDPVSAPSRRHPYSFLLYHLSRYMPHFTLKVVLKEYLMILKRKLNR